MGRGGLVPIYHEPRPDDDESRDGAEPYLPHHRNDDDDGQRERRRPFQPKDWREWPTADYGGPCGRPLQTAGKAR